MNKLACIALLCALVLAGSLTTLSLVDTTNNKHGSEVIPPGMREQPAPQSIEPDATVAIGFTTAPPASDFDAGELAAPPAAAVRSNANPERLRAKPLIQQGVGLPGVLVGFDYLTERQQDQVRSHARHDGVVLFSGNDGKLGVSYLEGEDGPVALTDENLELYEKLVALLVEKDSWDTQAPERLIEAGFGERVTSPEMARKLLAERGSSYGEDADMEVNGECWVFQRADLVRFERNPDLDHQIRELQIELSGSSAPMKQRLIYFEPVSE